MSRDSPETREALDALVLRLVNDVVEDYLAVIQISVEARMAQRSGRFTCACASCRHSREYTLDWVRAMREQPASDVDELEAA